MQGGVFWWRWELWEVQACLNFTHVAGVNEDRHYKLGGFMEELEKGMTSCKDGTSSLYQVLIAGCRVPGGVMG